MRLFHLWKHRRSSAQAKATHHCNHTPLLARLQLALPALSWPGFMVRREHEPQDSVDLGKEPGNVFSPAEPPLDMGWLAQVADEVISDRHDDHCALMTALHASPFCLSISFDDPNGVLDVMTSNGRFRFATRSRDAEQIAAMSSLGDVRLRLSVAEDGRMTLFTALESWSYAVSIEYAVYHEHRSV